MKTQYTAFILTVLALLLTNGPAHAADPVPTAGTSASQIWQKMVFEETHDRLGNARAIQPGCEPMHLAPQGVSHGTVILLHGYSACPQQFLDIANLIVAEGMEVYLPLSPGHGHMWKVVGKQIVRGKQEDKTVDDLSDLPTRFSSARYEDFANEVNELAVSTPGPRIIGGLSGGGALAAHAVMSATVPYDRVLLIAPWFHIYENHGSGIEPFFSRFFEAGLLAAERNLPLPHLFAPADWGPDCVIERIMGRGGYCSSLYDDVAGAETFGQETLEALKPTQNVQVVAVENDGTVDVPTILRATVKLNVPNTSICLMPSGLPHSFFSRHDNVTTPAPWIPAFEKATVQYIVKGTAFPQPKPSIVEGFHQCPVE